MGFEKQNLCYAYMGGSIFLLRIGMWVRFVKIRRLRVNICNLRACLREKKFKFAKILPAVTTKILCKWVESPKRHTWVVWFIKMCVYS